MSRLPANTNPMHEDIWFMMVSLALRLQQGEGQPEDGGERAAKPPQLGLRGAPILLS
jgi:hypothetical protein